MFSFVLSGSLHEQADPKHQSVLQHIMREQDGSTHGSLQTLLTVSFASAPSHSRVGGSPALVQAMREADISLASWVGIF